MSAYRPSYRLAELVSKLFEVNGLLIDFLDEAEQLVPQGERNAADVKALGVSFLKGLRSFQYEVSNTAEILEHKIGAPEMQAIWSSDDTEEQKAEKSVALLREKFGPDGN